MLFSNRVTFGGVTMVTFDLSTTFRNFGLVQTGVQQKDSDAYDAVMQCVTMVRP